MIDRGSRLVGLASWLLVLTGLSGPPWGSASGAPGDGADAFLSGAPLDSLTETRQRPLFVPSRRPAAAPARNVEPPASDPALANEPPRLTLLGVIRPPTGTAFAVLQDDADHRSVTLKPGEAKRGWIVRSIARDSVTLEKGGRTATLGFAKAPAASRLPEE